IGLVLVAVYAAQQFILSVMFLHNTGIVSCGYVIGAQIHGLIQELPEFDLAVAHHIRIWRAAALIFFEKIGKYFIIVFLLEIDGIVRDIDLLTDAPYVLGVLLRRTAAELIGIIPVFHENADNIISLLLEQQ